MPHLAALAVEQCTVLHLGSYIAVGVHAPLARQILVGQVVSLAVGHSGFTMALLRNWYAVPCNKRGVCLLCTRPDRCSLLNDRMMHTTG